MSAQPVRRSRIELLAPCVDFTDYELPPRVKNAPGMLSLAERRMLFGMMRERYRGRGAVIDAGSFFGSSTVSLARGLRDSRMANMRQSGFPDGKVIHAYDQGFMGKEGDGVRSFHGREYELGTSFVPVLQHAVAPFDDVVQLHLGDFNEARWPDFPIELAFIDLCKTPEVNAHVSAELFPHLVDGAILINQDFFFDRLPFIKVTMGYLAPYLEWVGQVLTSSIWVVRKPIPAEVAAHDPFTARDADVLGHHDRCLSDALDDETRMRVALSRAYLLAHLGEHDRALDEVARIRSDYDHVITDEATIARMVAFDANRGGPPRTPALRVKRAEAEIRAAQESGVTPNSDT